MFCSKRVPSSEKGCNELYRHCFSIIPISNPRMSTFRACGMCLMLTGATVTSPMPLQLIQARTHPVRPLTRAQARTHLPVRPLMSLQLVPQRWWAQAAAAAALEWTLLATHQSWEMTLKHQPFQLMMWSEWMMRWMVMIVKVTWMVTRWMVMRTSLIPVDPHIQPLRPQTQRQQ